MIEVLTCPVSLVFSHSPKNKRFAGMIPIPKISVKHLYGPLVTMCLVISLHQKLLFTKNNK